MFIIMEMFLQVAELLAYYSSNTQQNTRKHKKPRVDLFDLMTSVVTHSNIPKSQKNKYNNVCSLKIKTRVFFSGFTKAVGVFARIFHLDPHFKMKKCGEQCSCLFSVHMHWPEAITFSNRLADIKAQHKKKCVRSTRMPRQAQVPWCPSQLTSVANRHDENSMLRQGGA